jgi:glycosyltransferase involved in cell wall biosynthesis
MHIGLNAHLLSGRKGYRAAGIHGYIYHTLTHLAAVAPDDWQWTVLLGGGNPHTFPGLEARHAPFATDSPIARIVWEQAIQPVALRRFDLYHALAFVSPVIQPAPSVVTVYDLSFIHYPQVLSAARRAYLRAFTAWSCRRARRVIAISHSTAQDVHESLGIPMEKIDVAPAGYDQSQFYPYPPEQVAAFRAAQGLPDDFLLFVGTLEPRKNLTTLLDAYAQLPAESRLPLVLAGGKGWDYAPIFERIERYKLDVRLPGFLPAEALPLWYNSATAFVYPSVFEGFGLPVLEAMACGTPVVISDASSLPEVAGDAGLRVPPHDVSAWVAALGQAMHDRQWRTDAARRGLTEAKRYDWRATARQTVASYQRAL